MKYLARFFCLLTFCLLPGFLFAQDNLSNGDIRDEIIDDISRPGVSAYHLDVQLAEKVGDGLRVQGEFKVYNDKDNTSAEFQYALYSGQILGSKGILRPALPQEPLGSFILEAGEIRVIQFDVVLEEYFEEMHNGVELTLINERGHTFGSVQAKVLHEETQYPGGQIAIEAQSVRLNKADTYSFGSGITVYTNEDVADFEMILAPHPTPLVIIPEITYYDRSYFSEPVLVKRYDPLVTVAEEETAFSLPVTLMNYNLDPTIYPFTLKLDVQGENFPDPISFGRLTLGGVTAEVISVGFNNVRTADLTPQERINTIEIQVDGSLPDLTDDRRRQRIIDADIEVVFSQEGEIVYQDVQSAQILPVNELVLSVEEKLRLVDFDTIKVTISSDEKILDTFIEENTIEGGSRMFVILGGLLLLFIVIRFSMMKKKKEESEVGSITAAICLIILSSVFIAPGNAEAGARDYYDNRMGCERQQILQPGPPGPGGGPWPVFVDDGGYTSGSQSGSGTFEGGGFAGLGWVGPGPGAWFIADRWVNKWEYIEGFGGTFGHDINGSLNLSSEEASLLPDVRTITDNLLSPAQGCYQPGEIVAIQVEVSIGLCDNSSAGPGDDVDEVAVFQMTTGKDWYIDYGGVYDPALITTGPFTKPCPDNNDRTFDIVQLGDPSFDEMHARKRGWTVLSQGENTTQAGGNSINEVKTVYIQMPYEPGTYSLGTRLTVDPTKNGGIVEQKESIEVCVDDNPRDMCYLIAGLQYVDDAGILRDASGNVDGQPAPGDPSIDEYVIQYLDHEEIEFGFFDNPTGASSGGLNNFNLQTVCNLCPDPSRPTLPLNTFANRKEEWRDVTLPELNAHQSTLEESGTGVNGGPNDINRDYSEIEYQGLRTNGGAFAVETGTSSIQDAVVQHYDNGSQNKGNQSRMLKGVLWRNFLAQIENANRVEVILREVNVLQKAVQLKKREAELILSVIHLWTDADGNELYSEPIEHDGQQVRTGLVPDYHVYGEPPVNDSDTVPLYRYDNDPLVPYATGHAHAHFPPIARGIDDALNNIYDSDYDTTFLSDATLFRDFELTSFNQTADAIGLPEIEYDIEYTFNEYQYPAGTVGINGYNLLAGGTTYGVFSFDEMLTDADKSQLLQQWLEINYADPEFDGCYGSDCFANNTDLVCAGNACTSCSPGSCAVSEFFVPFSAGTNSQVLAAHGRTYDEYYAHEPIFAEDNIDAYDFMKNTLWADLVSVRARLLDDIQEYKNRQVERLREIEDLPLFIDSDQTGKWSLVENYRLYEEQIDLPYYDATTYALDLNYLSDISGIDQSNFVVQQLRTYQTYIKAFYDNVAQAMEHLTSRVDLDESTGNSRDSGLDDGDTSDVHVIQTISGNDRTCVAFEDICAEAGIQSAFLNESDPNTVELYDIDAVTGEKIDADAGTAGVNPRRSLSIVTASVAALCDAAIRPECPNNSAWDYDTTTNVVYEKNSDVVTGATYDATKNLCLTQCVAPAPSTHYYDSTDVNTTAQAVYDTSDAGTTPLPDWLYDSTTAATCIQDACPSISGQQELVGGSNPAQAQDVGNPANSYYIASLSGGGTQCVVQACTGSPGLVHSSGADVFWNDSGTIRTLGGEDTNFNYNPVGDICTSSDVCINLAGDQETPPGPPPGTYTATTYNGNPNYCDYCPDTDLSGIQNAAVDGRVLTYDPNSGLTTEEKGWYQTPGGSCTSDLCVTSPAEGSVQLYRDLNTGVYNQVSDDTPTDYVKDETLYCQIDVCSNVANSLQINGSGQIDVSVVPDGYVDNGNGTCSQIDVCLNIPGAQASIPSDYVAGSIANTCDFCGGQNGRPDIAGVQHIQTGSFTNSGGSPGVLSDANMYEYQSTDTWSLVTDLNSQTCEPLVCPNLGGVGFAEDGSGNITYNGNITDLEFTTGLNCACSDSGITPGDEACYDCLQTNYLNKSLGGPTCPGRPDELCQLVPGPGTILISGDDYYNTADGVEIDVNGTTYRLGSSGGTRTCSEVASPTFELRTTPGFIEIGDNCDIDLDALNVDQCRITLLDSAFTSSNSCDSGDGSTGSECIIVADAINSNVAFSESLIMNASDGSVLVVAECAPDGADIDAIIDESEYTLETSEECRIPPNIGEI